MNMQTDLSKYTQDQLKDRIVQMRALKLFVGNEGLPVKNFYGDVREQHDLTKNEYYKRYDVNWSFGRTMKERVEQTYEQFTDKSVCDVLSKTIHDYEISNPNKQPTF